MPLPNCELLSAQDASDGAQAVRWNQMTSGLQPSAIVVGASPFTYTNALAVPADVMISGGTVLTISIQRATGGGFILAGLLAGQYHTQPGDQIRITYVVAPTMTLMPF